MAAAALPHPNSHSSKNHSSDRPLVPEWPVRLWTHRHVWGWDGGPSPGVGHVLVWIEKEVARRRDMCPPGKDSRHMHEGFDLVYCGTC